MEFKDKLTRHLMDILYDFVPQVKGRIEYYHLGTPLSEVTFLGSYRGGSYGTKCVTDMFAPINRNWTTTPFTEIPGLCTSIIFILHIKWTLWCLLNLFLLFFNMYG